MLPNFYLAKTVKSSHSLRMGDFVRVDYYQELAVFILKINAQTCIL